MKRKIMEKLLQWRNQQHTRMPMLLYGARQVGKTFVMREQAASAFSSAVYVNFEEDLYTGIYARREKVSSVILYTYFSQELWHGRRNKIGSSVCGILHLNPFIDKYFKIEYINFRFIFRLK